MPESGGRRRWPLAAVLAIASLHMLVFDRGLGGDGWASFAAVESVVDDGDLWLEDDLRGVDNGIVRGANGHLVMQYPPGIVALDLGPFLAGRVADRVLPSRWMASGADLPPVGRVPRRVFLEAAAIVLARNVESLLGILWIALMLERLGFGERISAVAAGLAFFGGPMVFYSLVGMSHAPAFALAALVGWLLAGGRRSLGTALGVGAAIGGAVLVRYGAVAWLPAAMLALWGRERRWRAVALALAGFVVWLPLLPLVWHISAGSWGPPGYGGRMAVSAASPWNVLFAAQHGLFWFHPAMAVAAAGLIAMAAKGRWRAVVGIALVGFLSVATFNGWWSEWANAGGYGQRFLIDALPALAVGFAGALAGLPAGGWRRVAMAASAAGVVVGYLLFFAAVGGLVAPPAPFPWPQRVGDYRRLWERPPGPREVWGGMRRASVAVRAIDSRR
jgi:hypothetical protein